MEMRLFRVIEVRTREYIVNAVGNAAPAGIVQYGPKDHKLLVYEKRTCSVAPMAVTVGEVSPAEKGMEFNL